MAKWREAVNSDGEIVHNDVMLAQCLMHRDVGLAKKLAIKMGLEDDEAMMDLIKSFEIMQSQTIQTYSDKYIQFDILQHYLTFVNLMIMFLQI